MEIQVTYKKMAKVLSHSNSGSIKHSNCWKVLKPHIISRLSSKPHKNKNYSLKCTNDTTLGPIKQPNEICSIY